MCMLQYYDTEWTLWDRFEVDGEITLKEFLDLMQVRAGQSITNGAYYTYAQ